MLEYVRWPSAWLVNIKSKLFLEFIFLWSLSLSKLVSLSGVFFFQSLILVVCHNADFRQYTKTRSTLLKAIDIFPYT